MTKHTGILLRDYQSDIIRRVVDSWASNNSVLVQMPTGTGKTVVLASLVSEQLKLKSDKHGCSVWIVAHRRELVEQIEETVARYGIRKEYGVIKVLSIQWLARHWDDVQGEQPGLIVIDEAHHALAETYKELWQRYPAAMKLGMTATPCRLNRVGFTDLFDVLVTSYSIADFIRQGWLAAFDYVSIRQGSETQKLIESLKKRGMDGDFQVKEMDAVLNKRPSIERLHDSVKQYAGGKKGIVYAISISHARNIADYYGHKGITAAAIDSKTPAKIRKQLVEDFRHGNIQVLVNVDVFSEGFDCPDVEFVQLARPTLSLAKYLQQVGRGLRVAENKQSCVIIDNVGLYRLFGLPAADRDWQAMFEGRMAGKGHDATSRNECYYPAMADCSTYGEPIGPDPAMEIVLTHERLLEYLKENRNLTMHLEQGKLMPFIDRRTGLYGLRRGDMVTTTPQFKKVYATENNMAAVLLTNGSAAVCDCGGKIIMALGKCRKLAFTPKGFIATTAIDGKVEYTDLATGHKHDAKPKVKAFGQVEVIETDRMYCSRTKRELRWKPDAGSIQTAFGGKMLFVHDFGSRPQCHQILRENNFIGHRCSVLVAGDKSTYYNLSGILPDGNAIIEDTQGTYYLTSDGARLHKIYFENQTSPEGFYSMMIRLLTKAEARKAADEEKKNRFMEERRRRRLDSLQGVIPFMSGNKWGLRHGQIIVVPPIYRSIQAPVGMYCAVEERPSQWGVIMIDGKIIVEAKYSKVEIEQNGTAHLTLTKGNTQTVKLGT